MAPYLINVARGFAAQKSLRENIPWFLSIVNLTFFRFNAKKLWGSSKYFPRYKESKYGMTQAKKRRFRDFKWPYISEPDFKKFKMKPVGL